LVVVTVEGLLRFDAVLLHEADTADGVRVKQLLVGRHDLRADLIVTGDDDPHAMFCHHEPSHTTKGSVLLNKIVTASRSAESLPPFNAIVELAEGWRRSGT
jgi:hypothetical protein